MANITIPGLDAAVRAAATASDWSKQLDDISRNWVLDRQLTESLAEAVARATSLNEPFKVLRDHAGEIAAQASAMTALTRGLVEPVNAMHDRMAQFTELPKVPTLPEYFKATPNWTAWVPPAFPEPRLRLPETSPHVGERCLGEDRSDAKEPPCFVNLGVDKRYFPPHFFRLVRTWFEGQMERHGRSSIPGCDCHERSTAEEPLVVMVTEDPETGTIIFQCAGCSKRDLRGAWAELREARRGLREVEGGAELSEPRASHLHVVPDDE